MSRQRWGTRNWQSAAKQSARQKSDHGRDNGNHVCITYESTEELAYAPPDGHDGQQVLVRTRNEVYVNSVGTFLSEKNAYREIPQSRQACYLYNLGA